MTDLFSELVAYLDSLVQRRPSLWTRTACGVTRSQREIPALLEHSAYLPQTHRARVLLVSGLSGLSVDLEQALGVLELFASAGQRYSNGVALSAVPCGNPDRLILGGDDKAESETSTGYPPEGNYFDHGQYPEKRYLWRWICYQAPDLVLEVRNGDRIKWEANQAAQKLAPAVAADALPNDTSLLAALGKAGKADLGPIPGLRLTVPNRNLGTEVGRLLSFIPQFSAWEPSPARRTLDYRRSRSRLGVAKVLDSVYGHRLNPINYTQGVAISGRLRLAALNEDTPDVASEIVSMLDAGGLGQGDAFGDSAGPASLAGVVWGPELAEATGDRRWFDLLLQAAGRFRAGDPGTAQPPADPNFRTEDMFMSGALLGRAFGLTGEESYLRVLTAFLLDGDIQQKDGLFWHCRSAPYLWGRGNGFAALGLAETLSYLPDNHPHEDKILSMFQRQAEAVRRCQQPSGMYPQVLNLAGSYQEFTATCMFGYAMARGVRRGWLDSSFLEPVQLAWQGVCERIDDAGEVVDACVDTGVQGSLRDYLDRPALQGLDDRSGGMALWFSVELERLSRGE